MSEALSRAIEEINSDPELVGEDRAREFGYDPSSKPEQASTVSGEDPELELDESEQGEDPESVDDESVDNEGEDFSGDESDDSEPDEFTPVKKFDGKEYDLSTNEGFEQFQRDQQAYFTRRRQADADEARAELERVNREKEQLAESRREVEQLKADLELILSKPENEDLREQYQDVTKEDRLAQRLEKLEKTLEAERAAKEKAEQENYRSQLFSRLDSALKIPTDLNKGLVEAVRERTLRRAAQMGLMNESDVLELYRAEISPLMEMRRGRRKDAAKKKVSQGKTAGASGRSSIPPRSRPKNKADTTGGKKLTEGGLENKINSVLAELELR